MEVLLLLRAQSEIQELYNFFEKRSSARAEFFLKETRKTLDLIEENPEMGPVYRGRFRRKLMTRIPIGICYSIEGK